MSTRRKKGVPPKTTFDTQTPAMKPAAAKMLGQFSQGDVARGTGLSPSTICKIFSGSRGPMTRNLEKIAGFLGVRVDKLLAALRS